MTGDGAVLQAKVVEAEVAYCRRALGVALERAIFTADEEERARALAVLSTLEERLARVLTERMHLLAY